jgi:segregation and condensation protein B
VVAETIAVIQARFQDSSSGFELVHVAEKYQFRSKAAMAPYLRLLRAEKPRRLSAAALETLSIVAYRQPIVKSDMEKIRGVDVTPTLKTLLERKLIKIIGHQASVGQPALYGTTDEFLKLFGLSSLSALPTLRDLNELESDPGESGAEESVDEQIEGSSAGETDKQNAARAEEDDAADNDGLSAKLEVSITKEDDADESSLAGSSPGQGNGDESQPVGD